MAWSRLQSNSGTSASGNPAVAYTANLTSGSVLIAVVSLSSSEAGNVALNAVATCSDGTNSLTYIGAVLNGTVGYLGLFALATPAGDAGTKPTITATVNALVDNFGCSLLIQEISGITATPDGTLGTGNGTASPATTGSYSSTASSEYLLVAYGDPGYSVTETTPSGYSPDANNISDNGDANVSVFYKNSAGTSESASITLSGSADWMTLIVAFPLANPPTSGPVFHPAVQALRARFASGRIFPPAGLIYGGCPSPAAPFALSGTGRVAWNLGGPVLNPPGQGPPLRKGPLPNFPVIIAANSGWRNAGHSR